MAKKLKLYLPGIKKPVHVIRTQDGYVISSGGIFYPTEVLIK